jgi:putative endonuclease
MTRTRQLGQAGEAAAAAHVERLGWRIVSQNWRPSDPALRGELDLVADDAIEIVFCEVKTRSGIGAGDPLEAITPDKVRQLRRLASAWLTEHNLPYRTVRFDVIGVYWPPSAIAPTIEHRRDVVG